MNAESQPHIFEQIEAYLAGGLSPEEQLALEAHAASCAACAAALAEAREADARVRSLLEDATPSCGFEDRLIRSLRVQEKPRRRWIHPAVLRTAGAIAAVVVLTSAGAAVSTMMEQGSLRSWWTGSERVREASNLKQIGLATAMYRSNQQAILSDSLPQIQRAAESAPSAAAGVVDQKDAESSRSVYYRGRGLAADAQTMNYQPERELRRFSNGEDFEDLAKKPQAKPTAVTEYKEEFGEKKADANTPDSFFLVAKTQDLNATVFNTPATNAAPDPFVGNAATTQPAFASGRKVIRNGTMVLEVDRFDDAFSRITKLVSEQGGFIATTDSDKLPNGKTKGVITLRVPPEHLDSLVLMLRGIGDLKSQKIGAEDVTKHYTDLESGLRAARAMEERLLEIIKTGKGQIKDLLEAEKQLSVWREKIEQIEGEKRYLDNQVALATLAVELYERDIRTPATASETEQVELSLETEKVDEAYDKARAAIESAKGRIVQAELKQYDAGQFGATIQAAVPPDAAEQVIARLRQLQGRIAHFSRDSRRTTQNGESPQPGITSVHREDVIVSMQIYNLANVAPRRTTSLQLAATDVESAYQKAIDQVRSAGGRIVTSSLTKSDANQPVGDVEFQLSSEKADAVQSAVRDLGDVVAQESTENADTANVTEAKRGFRLRIVSAQSLPPRQTATIREEVADVERAVNDVENAAASVGGKRVGNGQINQDRAGHVTAQVVVDVPMSKAGSILDQLERMGSRRSREVTFDNAVPDGRLARARIDVTLSNSSELLGGEQSTWDAVRHALSVTGAALRWSLQMLVIGVCFVAPWVLVLWGIWRLVRRKSRRTPAST